MKKRYAIVRVDINCPKDVCGEEAFCLLSKGKTLADMCDYCEFLQEKRIIGDTKEQMIKKAAQVMFENDPKETYYPKIIEQKIKILKVAKEIVEFLGVI